MTLLEITTVISRRISLGRSAALLGGGVGILVTGCAASKGLSRNKGALVIAACLLFVTVRVWMS